MLCWKRGLGESGHGAGHTPGPSSAGSPGEKHAARKLASPRSEDEALGERSQPEKSTALPAAGCTRPRAKPTPHTGGPAPPPALALLLATLQAGRCGRG